MGSQPSDDLPFDGKQLTSWKEIAAYLGVTVRTAQKWEIERGLPVRRLPGKRGMVLISVAEIENWMAGAERTVEEPKTVEQPPARRRLFWLGGIGAAVASGLGGVAWHLRNTDTPSSHKLEGNSLVALNIHGHELWRHEFDFRLANEELRRQPSLQQVQYCWIGDLDNDGQLEVLFIPNPETPKVPKNWDLYCFSANGEVKWRFKPGQSGEKFPPEYRPPYCPLNMLVFDLAGEKRIAVASVHNTWHPSQIAVLSGQGKLLQEYWHSGHLIQLEVAPGGSNRGPLLLAGGISNGFRSAALVALDPSKTGVTGASKEERAAIQLPGPTGQEIARVLFPRSRINARKGPYNAVCSLRNVDNEIHVAVREDLEAGAEVLHRFGPGLRYLGAGLSSNYIGRYRELESMGMLSAPLRASDEERELSRIRWIQEPARS